MNNGSGEGRIVLSGPSFLADGVRSNLGRSIEVTRSIEAVLDAIDRGDVLAVVTEFQLEDGSGVELVRSVRDTAPDLPVVLWTAEGSETIASDAISAGVTDYVIREGAVTPEDVERLLDRLPNQHSGTGLGGDREVSSAQGLSDPDGRADDDRARPSPEIGPIGILISDSAGRVINMNPGIRSVFKIDDVERIDRLYAGDEWSIRDAEGEPIDIDHCSSRRALASGEPVYGEELHLYRSDGEVRRLIVNAVPISDANGVTERRVMTTFMDVTEQHHRDGRHRANERKFRAVFEGAFDAMMIADDDAKYVEVNPAATDLFGLSGEQLLGRSIREFAAPEYDFDEAWAAFRDSDSDRGTFPLVDADGNERTVEFAATPDILPGRHLSVIRDITDRWETRNQLRRERDRARKYLDTAGVMMVALDEQGKVTLANRRAREVLGVNRQGVIGRDWFASFIPESDRRETRTVFERLMDGDIEPTEQYENRVVTTNGDERIVEWRNTVLRDENEVIIGTLSSGRDVTERRHRERALREEREKYSTVVEHSNDGIVIVQDGRLAFVNERFAEFHGTTREALLGEPFLANIDPEYHDLVADRYERRINGDGPENRYEVEILDGARTLEVNARSIDYEGCPAVMGIVRDVTAEKRRLRELERHEVFLEGIRDLVTVIDGEGVIRYESPAVTEIHGYEQESRIGESSLEYIHPEDRDRVRGLLQDRLAGAEWNGAVRYRARDADGAWRWVESHGRRLESDDSGDRFVVTTRDVEKQKRREDQVFEKHQQLQAIVDASPDPIIQLDDEGVVSLWNDAAERVFGLSADDALGSELTDLDIVPTGDNRFEDRLQRALKGESFEGIEVERRTKTGDTVNLRISTAPTRAPDGTITGVMGIVQDITERKRREADLELFRTLVDKSRDGIVVADADSANVVDANVRACEMLGYSHDELLSLSIPDFNTEMSRDRWPQHVAAVYEKETLVIESTHRRKDGTTLPVEISISHAHLDSEYLIGVVRDITDRKARERELQASERKFRSLIETAPDPIFVADATTGEIVETNDTACEVLNRPCEEIVGMHQSNLHPDDEQARYEALFEQHIEEGGTISRFPDDDPVFMCTADGDRIPVSISARSVTLDDRHLIHGIFRDVSERIHYEESLKELHRATRRFLAAESDVEIAREMVAVATDVLEMSFVAVYTFDEERGELTPADHSTSLERLAGRPPSLCPGDSVAWRVFTEQESAQYDDVRTADDVYNPDTPIRSELIIPLGEHGVFIAGSPEIAAIESTTRGLAEILTGTAVAALDRMDRTRELRLQERAAHRHANQLERATEITDKIRTIIQSITESETRPEIEESVCRELSAIDRFAFVWTGDFDRVADEITPAAWAGTSHGYLDALSLTLDEGPGHPAIDAVTNREPTVVSNIAASIQQADWRQEAMLEEFRSVIAVPLLHDGIVYGVLTVYGSEPDAFGPQTRAVLDELGELIGYAFNALERRSTYLGTDIVEITFELSDWNGPFSRLASRVGTELEIRNVSPRPDGSFLVHVLARSDDRDHFVRVAEANHVVDDVRPINDSNPALFELIVSGPSLATAVADMAVTIDAIVLDHRESQISVAVPRERGMRSFVDRFCERYPEANLIKRRDSDRDGTPIRLAALLDHLTDRQREVLRAAYYGGFFEQPRRSTGTEIADSLGISQPAFSKQLRTSERKLLTPLYEPG